jgi:hypothetical protein
MVKMAEPSTAYSSSSRSPNAAIIENTIFRKLGAVAMILLLYTAATPFSPIGWIATDLSGAYMLDRLFAGALLFSALYFQWRMACQLAPIAIILPFGSGQTIRNGQLVAGTDFGFVYRPVEYWKYIGVEAAILALAEFGGQEILRRALVSGVIAGLWAVGWTVTPDSVKQRGWEYLKQIWFWIALDEIMRVGLGSGRGGARRGGARRW